MIRVFEPSTSLADCMKVYDCIKYNQLTMGPAIEEFETRWAEYCGRKHGISVCNGTAALQLMLEVLDLKPTDEVIIPAFTIISCALAVIRTKAKLVIADIDETWCLDPESFEKLITPNTKAVMVVHIYGQPANMANIQAIADKHNITILEDAAEAHGATHNATRCGKFGLMSCFSFYSNKIITTGEGGMILTDDDELNKRLRNMRNLCFGEGEDRFTHAGLGHNFRLTNFQAALGCSQLNLIETTLKRKTDIAMQYHERFLPIKQITIQPTRLNTKSVYWMNGILVPDPKRLAKTLLEEGIETRPFFTGMHRQPALNVQAECPKTDHISKHGLYLPSGDSLTPAKINQVCDKVIANL